MLAPTAHRCRTLATLVAAWCILIVPVAVAAWPTLWPAPESAASDVRVPPPPIPANETWNQKDYRQFVIVAKAYQIMYHWDVCYNKTGMEHFHAMYADHQTAMYQRMAEMFRGEDVAGLIRSLEKQISVLQEESRRNNDSHAAILQRVLLSTGIIQLAMDKIDAAVGTLVEGVVRSVTTTVLCFLLGLTLFVLVCQILYRCSLFAMVYVTNPYLAGKKIWTWLRERNAADTKRLEEAIASDLIRRDAALSSSSAAPDTETPGSPVTVLAERDDDDEDTETETAAALDAPPPVPSAPSAQPSADMQARLQRLAQQLRGAGPRIRTRAAPPGGISPPAQSSAWA